MSISDGELPRLDSELLRSFLAVSMAGSVSGGALRLLRTQSAVSLQLQRLEAIVGQRLFDRHGRGVSMTAAGERLLPVARRVVDALDRALVELRGALAGGEIRFAIPEEYGDTILPSVLGAFAREQPNARILVRCGASMDFPRALAEGELDVALHSPERPWATDRVVHHEAAVWAGSAFHEVEGWRPLPVALFDRSCWWRERCLDLLQRSGLEHRIVCTSDNVAGIRAAIAAGIAVGVLPESALTSEVRLLSDDALPHLGQSPLVISTARAAPAPLSDILIGIIARSVQEMGRP